MNAPRFLAPLLGPTPLGFSLRAGLLLLALSVASLTPWFRAQVEAPSIRFNAQLTHWTLAALGIPTRVEGAVVRSLEGSGTASFSPFSIEVIPACTGLFAAVVVFSLTIAFPAGWARRLAGLLLGALVISGLNWLRLVSLFLLGPHLSRELFEEIHVFVWQGAFILIVAFFWYGWARWALRPSRPAAAERLAAP